MAQVDAPIVTDPDNRESVDTAPIPLSFYPPEATEWKLLTAPDDADEKVQKSVADAKADVKAFLLSSLQMQHVVVLAGSGTSLGSIVNGPSMKTLWNHCAAIDAEPNTLSAEDVGSDGETEAEIVNEGGSDVEQDDIPNTRKLIGTIISEVNYSLDVDKENIEALLSRCEAYQQLNSNRDVDQFVMASKKLILEQCSNFIEADNKQQLASHCTFLHRLSRRRTRDSRLKIFTTNYDLCFESAAGRQGLVVLDGFSFSRPRRFDPRFFLYDIVRRPTSGNDVGTPLEGVFHLYKLHGSVNWCRTNEGDIEEVENPDPKSVCMIYPAKGKYQQSYAQPHLELVSQYFSSLREPNTCLVVIGFGFNDDHLSEPILNAVRTNPHLRLIIVNLTAKKESTGENKYWKTFFGLASQGEDVWFFNASFGEFAELIPDLKSLTPAQRLTRDIKQIADA